MHKVRTTQHSIRQHQLQCHLRNSTGFSSSAGVGVTNQVNSGWKSGFKVGIRVADSPIGGKGVFVTEDITRGTMIWECSTDNCKFFTTEADVEAYVKSLSNEELVHFLEHAYCDQGAVIEMQDEAQFWNHSERNPNTGNMPKDMVATEAGEEYKPEYSRNTYAVRDISAGEELLDNYDTYEVYDWFEKLCQKHEAMSLAECVETCK